MSAVSHRARAVRGLAPLVAIALFRQRLILLAIRALRCLKRRQERRPIRVYMDGCFDMLHYGHANALRQARALGDELVVGLVPDSEILRHKGPPVMNDRERYVAVESVKWVDEIITGVPYDITEDFMTELFEKHRIDYIVHGDDPCITAEGLDAYASAKKAGRYKEIKRTEGVSTTDIVGRMLLCARFQRTREESIAKMSGVDLFRKFCSHDNKAQIDSQLDDHHEHSFSLVPRLKQTRVTQLLPTSRRIVQFSSNQKISPHAKVVYIDGSFDVFHPGHIEILKNARKLGDFLLVGVHTDEDISRYIGPHYPIMSLHERALSVLSCRYVDEVVIGAPWCVTSEMISNFNISRVAAGEISGCSVEDGGVADKYTIPRSLGIFSEEAFESVMTLGTIVARIIENSGIYQAKYERKSVKEKDYVQHKTFVEEV